jgi:hypothetical protein
VLTEEKFDDIGATLKRTSRISRKRLPHETGASKSSARRETQLPKLRPYKTTAIHALQPRDSTSSAHFFSWFLQSVVEGEIDPQLALLSAEAWFHLQGYINTQNNRYWSSQNPHLTDEVTLHPVKVGACCAVSAIRLLNLRLFNETINCERYLRVERTVF